MEELSVSSKFDMIRDYTTIIAMGKLNSFILTGESGIGKSFTIMSVLNDLKTDYKLVKGFSTPRALYDTLYLNKHKLLVFDDCDSILKDKVAVNILKGALDTYEERPISWLSKSKDTKIPNQFNFSGQVIFISNLHISVFDDAMKSRALIIDLKLTFDEKYQYILDNISELKPDLRFTSFEVAQILFYIENNVIKEEHLNFRLLEQALVIVDSLGGITSNWEQSIMFLLTNQ